MQLNRDFPHKLYLDTKVLVNGKKKKPRDLNLEKHIELGKWIQDMIDSEELRIPCTCESEPSFCSATVTNDVFKFQNNGLGYQFLDILANDIINLQGLEDLQIQIVDDADITGGNTVESFTSQFYPYPIIKLTKPSSEQDVGNIDEPQEFTYKITGKCANDEGFESNIATVTILPVSVNIEEFIDENR